MKLYFIILAHRLPDVHAGLVQALSHPDSHIVSHVDARVELDLFRQGVLPCANVNFVSDDRRIPVSWGGWSQVEATLRALAGIRDSLNPNDYVTLLSGDSYPLLSPDRVHAFFETSPLVNYISANQMPSIEHSKPLRRLSRYYFEGERDGGVMAYAKRVHNKFTPLPRPYKSRLGNRTPYAGGQWWTLTGEAADWLLSEVSRDSQFVKLARHSRIPDEFFFQTLLHNSPFKESIRPSLMFTDWTPISGPRPAPITSAHIWHLREKNLIVDQEGEKGTVVFARKVDNMSIQRLVRELLW